jgi:hypothetical protein
MKVLALLLAPAALFAAEARYARLGEFEGKVEVQLSAAEAWMPAERNLPLPEMTWIRTGASARMEIELDDGSAFRLGPDSQAEISDYTRLSTGQRVTLLSLDRGLGYFTGEAQGKDSLMLAVPGAQVTVTRGARVRLEALEQSSRISIIEGVVRFSSPSAEIDLRESQSARVEPANPARFFLDREVAAMDLDKWSEGRDKALEAPVSAAHVFHRYGVADLDPAGEWIHTDDLGAVWKPKSPDGWAPFRNGRWRWYQSLGYTWVSGEPWGWLPYHYGRWARNPNLGWVWAPSLRAVFKPGEVYWLKGARLAGWGPLAPGERWNPADPANPQPQQFANANTTYAAFELDAAEIDPAGFTARPLEPLKAAAFALALPSPSFPAARLDATRPVLRAGSTRIRPVLPGVTFQDPAERPEEPPITQPPPITVQQTPEEQPTPDVVAVPVPVPVGVIFVDPPYHPDYSRPSRQHPPSSGGQPATPPAATPAPAPEPDRPATTRVVQLPPPHVDPARERNQPAIGVLERPAPAQPPQAPPAPRNDPSRDRRDSPAPPTPAPAPERPAPSPSRAPAAAPSPKNDAPPDKPDGSKGKPQGAVQSSAFVRAGRLRPGESEIIGEVVNDLDRTQNFAKALADLDTWSRRYPKSDFSADRCYYYVRAYSARSQPAKVVDFAAPLIAGGLAKAFIDSREILGVLYLTAANARAIPSPSAQQLAAGGTAARQLLDYLPEFFTAEAKPPGAAADWARAREAMEAVARNTLAWAAMCSGAESAARLSY